MNPLFFWEGLMKNLFSFEPPLLNPLYFVGVDEKSFLAFFITNNQRVCQKQAIVLKMKKSFLAFLVSGKLDANLSGSF